MVRHSYHFCVSHGFHFILSLIDITGGWRCTGTGSAATLPASIHGHRQSTLSDGSVLISGGNGYRKTIYIYTPNTNTWTEVASLPVGIIWHGQSALNDGRVLISAGQISGGDIVNDVYIYTSSSNSWASATPLPTAGMTGARNSTLTDGRVMISGGYSSIGLNTTHIYKPDTKQWVSSATLDRRIWAHGQSTLLNGQVLVSGGHATTSYIYTPDIGIGSWKSVATMDIDIGYHGQSTLTDGKVLVSGGYTGNAIPINNSYIYIPDAGAGSWTSASPMPTGFYHHGQSTLTDGRVMVSGGAGTGYDGKGAYIYTPAGWVAVGIVHFYNYTLICPFP